MSLQPQSDIVRRSDGSIDIAFYARRGAAMRDAAMIDAFASAARGIVRAARWAMLSVAGRRRTRAGAGGEVAKFQSA